MLTSLQMNIHFWGTWRGSAKPLFIHPHVLVPKLTSPQGSKQRGNLKYCWYWGLNAGQVVSSSMPSVKLVWELKWIVSWFTKNAFWWCISYLHVILKKFLIRIFYFPLLWMEHCIFYHSNFIFIFMNCNFFLSSVSLFLSLLFHHILLYFWCLLLLYREKVIMKCLIIILNYFKALFFWCFSSTWSFSSSFPVYCNILIQNLC